MILQRHVDLRSPIEVWHTSNSSKASSASPADSIAVNLKLSGAFKKHKSEDQETFKAKRPKFSARREQQLTAIRDGRLEDAAAVSSKKDDILFTGTSRNKVDGEQFTLKTTHVNFMNLSTFKR